MKRVFVVPLLSAAAALVPACSDDHGSGGGGSAALLSDDFNRSSTGSDWHVHAGNGSAGIDDTQGNPQPAMRMSVSEGNSAVTAHSEMSFSGRPLTIIVDLQAATAGEASGGVEIVNASHVPLASAEGLAAAGGDMTFKIGGATQDVSLASTPSGFQRVTFTVDAAGNAAWSLGDTVVMTQPGFPAGPVSVQLFTRSGTGVPGSAFPTFLFDNVSVTSP